MQTISLFSLWLPIVLSAVAVFFASAAIWMLIKWHDSDWSQLPGEDAVRTALSGTPPGDYTLPYAMSNAARASEEWQAKCKEGPNAMLTVLPAGLPAMGKQLGLWFVYCLAVSLLVAYVLHLTVPTGVDYLRVFRIASVVGFLAYAGGAVPGSIWFGHGWGRTFKDVADGLLYGLLTAGVFGWLWP